jgi:guanylate kinase
MPKTNLLIITGQEGSGKTTICQKLLSQTKNSARIDAEDLGQTNPWEMNEKFISLLWKNVIALIRNFEDAGFQNIIAGSFLSTKQELVKFRECLQMDVTYYVIHLCASKAVRDRRRMERQKSTKREWRDRLDELYPEDSTLKNADTYKYIRIDCDNQSAEETIERIKHELPEIYT